MIRPSERVVITGVGVVSPFGVGLPAFQTGIFSGRSPVCHNQTLIEEKVPVTFAAQVPDWSPSRDLPPRCKPARMSRGTQFAHTALAEALRHATLSPEECAAEDVPLPIIIGVGASGMEVLENQFHRVHQNGKSDYTRARPGGAMAYLPQATASSLATWLDIPCSTTTLSTGCPSGLDAVMEACRVIRSGAADLAIAGGTDAAITPITMGSFAAANALSTRSDQPERASRPFDRYRDGGVMGEGAAVFTLERLDHALARGAVPLAECLSQGSAQDGPGSVDARGLELSMHQALEHLAFSPDQDRIDAIIAHGPSDPDIDLAEAKAIHAVFGEAAHHIPVTSIKGGTGNPIAAGGPFQVAAGLLSLSEGRIPPTANYEKPDPAIALDVVAGEPRLCTCETLLINTHGFGGVNSTLLLGAVSA